MKYEKYVYPILAIVVIAIAGCFKEKPYGQETPGDKEAWYLWKKIVGKAYVYKTAEDNRGRNLLKLYPCIADDTFHMNFYPYGMGPYYNVLIKQGRFNCAPVPGDLKNIEWGLDSNFPDEREVCLSFPFPFTTYFTDTVTNTTYYNYYSPVRFFKYWKNKNRFSYDSSFNLQLYLKTDSTEEHYLLSPIADSLWISTNPEK